MSGYAADARELNAGIAGTLAEKILKIQEQTETHGKIYTLGTIHQPDSDIGTIAKRYEIPDYKIYIFTQRPKSDGNYLFGGRSFIVIGMEYGNYLYGTQLAVGSGGIKHRDIFNGTWEGWKTATLA